MKILWLSWKDLGNPLAGGAEVVNEELIKRMAQKGHQIKLLTAGFEGAKATEIKDGYEIIRVGNRWSVYIKVFFYYKKNLKGWADLVIDEINTVPFFAKFFVKERNILFVHQLCRQIWFYEIFFPLNLIGYLLEPIYLWILKDRKTIAMSESTKKDLIRFGFIDSNIFVIREGIQIEPVQNLDGQKFKRPTLLSLGAVRPMKRTINILKAFEIAKSLMPTLQFLVAGDVSSAYGKEFLQECNNSKYKNSILILGKIPADKKREIMSQAHCIAVTSVKEGWGLIVTEAASQGTPAVVYNVDGLRDSVKNGITGLITEKNSPKDLAKVVHKLLEDKKEYQKIRSEAWQWSKEINFENSFNDFIEAIGNGF